MKRFWHDVIAPFLENIQPQHITEIGADTGINTRHLLELCQANNSVLTSIDPKPSYDVEAYKEKFGACFNPIFAMSLDAIPLIDHCDVMLIDGDHNWYTVYHELLAIEKQFPDRFPIILFHDTGWPYGRRDMYYDPSNIPAEHVQAHRKAGLYYGQSAISDVGGFNAHLNQAVEEGTARNGVLTAIEDFCEQSSQALTLKNYSGFNGLSVLYPSSRKEITDLLTSLNIPSRLTGPLEEARILSTFDALEYKNQLNTANEKLKHLEAENKQAAITLEKEKKQNAAKQQELTRELIRAREIAQSMRIKNRLKKMLGLSFLRQGDLNLLIESLRKDGFAATKAKLLLRLRDGGTHGKKPQSAQGRQRKLLSAKYTAAELEALLAKRKIQIPQKTPLVSIIILTHNGLAHLQRLFPALAKYTLYPAVEIIVVDNASNDGTLDYLESLDLPFPLELIRNPRNESYSYGHNQAAAQAKGEYLVFLNNDIVPLKGWLSALLATAETLPRVGAVGSQLVYPDAPNEPLSGLIQHAGIVFEHEYSRELQNTFVRPYNHGFGHPPEVSNDGELACEDRAALTAACLLLKKETYQRLGGLDETFVYGYEDVDLGLRLKQEGLRNIYCPTSLLIHHESSTQSVQAPIEVRNRRIQNMQHFHDKWYTYLYQHYFADKLSNTSGIFSEQGLHFAFAVTEAGPGVSAGDYFTAMELASALETYAYQTSFLTRRSGQWYDVDESIDVIVSMLDSYDLTEISDKRKKHISIAWIRNWPDRWLDNPSLSLYDILLCSSTKLCEMITEATGRATILFPIATNEQRFDRENHKDGSFISDYAFTGNYWGKPRDIELSLNPEKLDYQFALYGKDWQQVEKFKPWHRGFLDYKDIAKVYANTRVVIDDAVAGITRPYGSVNSRVFDATQAGALVLSNGEIGAKDLFADDLPTWNNSEELHRLLNHYLSDETARLAQLNKLQARIREHHTYARRAHTLLNVLKQQLGINKLIAIKMPIPSWEEAERWGDFHLARGLKKYFERKNYSVLLQVLPEWDNGNSDACDVVIVLRGLSRYTVKPHQLNFMWNISHPDKVGLDEYQQYDRIFVASESHADTLKTQLTVPVEVMHQCTDPEEFYPEAAEGKSIPQHQLLFVGNSRKVYRKILKDLIPCEHELAVYGSLWKGIIDGKYIKDDHIPNHQLAAYYAAADILLNDHWDSMRDYGFPSNRIFDALAAGAVIVSDRVRGMDKLFSSDELPTYETPEELHSMIDDLMLNPEKRRSIAGKARQRVLQSHTFAQRVEQFTNAIVHASERS